MATGTLPSTSSAASHTFTVQDFTCPICMELLYSPRTPSCGHTFCEQCLESWISNANDERAVVCPVDRKPLSADIPEVNVLVRELIRQAFLTEYEARGQAVAEAH
eukprot:RCo015133